MLTTPPLSPKTLTALKELGIRTLERFTKNRRSPRISIAESIGFDRNQKYLVATGRVGFRNGCPAYFRGEKDGAGRGLEKPSACCRFPFAKRYGSLYVVGDRTGQTIGGIG